MIDPLYLWVISQHLCQMVHDVGLWHGAKDCLQTVLATGWWMASIDASYDSLLDQMIISTINKFTIVKKLADDIAVLLQPACPGSSLGSTLLLIERTTIDPLYLWVIINNLVHIAM